ncbi:MAG: hypothetical protein Phog2KO_48150 [Phototrophicaceae bacterium]
MLLVLIGLELNYSQGKGKTGVISMSERKLKNDIKVSFYLQVDEDLLSEAEIRKNFDDLKIQVSAGRLDIFNDDRGSLSILIDDIEILGSEHVHSLRFLIPEAFDFEWGKEGKMEGIISTPPVAISLELDFGGFIYELRDARAGRKLYKRQRIVSVIEFLQRLTECQYRILRLLGEFGDNDVLRWKSDWMNPDVLPWNIDIARIKSQLDTPLLDLLGQS